MNTVTPYRKFNDFLWKFFIFGFFFNPFIYLLLISTFLVFWILCKDIVTLITLTLRNWQEVITLIVKIATLLHIILIGISTHYLTKTMPCSSS